MIVYHGTPFGGQREQAARVIRGRFVLIPWLRQEDLGAALEFSRGFVVDNSAFTAWKTGKPITDWKPYMQWVFSLSRHPAFHWAIIPDVIDGSEKDNDELLREWNYTLSMGAGRVYRYGVPVWHLHESLERLLKLRNCYDTVALGSSGEYKTPGTDRWHDKMAEAMRVLCNERGEPLVKIHGLRMAAPDIVKRYPFASVDSTNAAQNSGLTSRFGMYTPATMSQRADQIARNMEEYPSAKLWRGADKQTPLFQFSELPK